MNDLVFSSVFLGYNSNAWCDKLHVCNQRSRLLQLTVLSRRERPQFI